LFSIFFMQLKHISPAQDGIDPALGIITASAAEAAAGSSPGEASAADSVAAEVLEEAVSAVMEAASWVAAVPPVAAARAGAGK
jgi:hypothetical protein